MPTFRSTSMADLVTNPFPPLPPTIKIPKFDIQSKQVGFLNVPSPLPFYYAGIQSLWIVWQVEPSILEPYLTPLGLKPALFGGMGAVNINFFNAAAMYGQGQPGNPGVGGFNETEVNLVAYPVAQEAGVPRDLTLLEFLAGGDQTKRIGVYRLHVACDNPIAVAAGKQLFAENKFLTSYDYNVPSLNNPGVSTYDWTCHDPTDVTQDIYRATVDLAGLSSVPGNTSEWIDLSYVKSAKRVAASRRNYLGTCDTYALSATEAKAVTLTIGTQSTHKMRQDMSALIGSRPAVAVQLFKSPTVIAEARPYWADIP
jgi:hypothetical protein